MNFKFLVVAALVFCGFNSFSQNVSVGGGGVLYLKPMSNSEPANFKRGSYVEAHILGDSISSRLNLFEKNYVYFKMSNGAYPVEERVVLKRNLYKKIKEFESFIVKGYNADLISRTNAQIRLGKVLDIGIKLMNFDTRQVEKDVKKLEVSTDLEKYLLSLKFQ